MGISNRAYTILVCLTIILFILIGIWIVNLASNFRVESKNYKYDNNLDSKIDVVVEQGGEGLNKLENNEIHTNKIRSNQIITNQIESNKTNSSKTNVVNKNAN